MFVGILSLHLSIPYAESIKEKRNIIRSLKDTVRKKFNVSIADVSDGESNIYSTLIAIAGVSSEANYLQSNLANILNLVETMYHEYIVSHTVDILSYFPDETPSSIM